MLFAIPSTAVAACSGGAVGDQYCDPLSHATNGGNSGGGGSSGGGGGGGTSPASLNGSANGRDPGPSESAAARARLRAGLPATGVSVGSMLAFGVALIASGFALRQLAVRPVR